MTDAHVALVVEDDAHIAEELGALVRSLGHTARHVVTLQGVRAEVEKGGFCYVVLDMEIPADELTRPHPVSGRTALSVIRKRFPERNGTRAHKVPVLVLTGYSAEPEFVNQSWREGADDFVHKTMKNLPLVPEHIQAILADAGREDHAACLPAPPLEPPAEPVSPTVRLSIDGSRAARRTVVRVSGARVELTDSLFLMLLRLVAARQAGDGGWCTHHDIGSKRGRAGPSRLRKELGAGLPEPVELVETNWSGSFRLAASVEIESVAWDKLREHADPAVRRIAKTARR